MKPIFKKLVTFSLASALTLSLLGALGLLGAYAYITPRLPDIDTLKDVRLQVPLRIYDKEGGLIAEFGEMKRTPLKYEEFPEQLIQAVLAAEDDRFFEHPGVDYQGILRAAINLILTGEKGQGGSTITMQVARNFFLSREKTYLRKLNEIFLALKIEGELSKEDILSLYLNKIYLGKRAYGASAAAQVYYDKALADLSLDEMAMIAGLPKAPSSYNPVANPARAIQRRNYVLGRMRDLDYISDEAYQLALAVPVHAKTYGQSSDLEAPYIAEMARNEMVTRYGDKAYTAGYEVYTSVDPRRQKAANRALRQALLEYDRRHGYRGPVNHIDLFAGVTPDPAVQPGEVPREARQSLLEIPVGEAQWSSLLKNVPAPGNLTPALVLQVEEQAVYALTRDNRLTYLPWEQINWAREYINENSRGPELESAAEVLQRGDVIYVTPAGAGCSWLAQLPQVGGALVSLNPDNGAIEALSGGFDYYTSKFNRVVQAERQPGSSFKPFIYSAAIDKGFNAASIINDAPVVFEAPGLEDTWRPENYSGRFHGPTRLRAALVNSRNLVSIRLLREIGIGYALRYQQRFGFDPNTLPRDLSLALGSGVLTPLELARGYAVFANGGYFVQPHLIDHVLDADQRVVLLDRPARVCPDCLESQSDGEIELVTDPLRQMDSTPPAAETWVPSFTRDDVTPGEWRQVMQGPRQPRIAPRVLTPQTAFLMNSMMRDVVRRGTGRGAMVLGREDLAGKTGTTNDQQDAWFSGFNRNLVSTAWVGFDTPQPLGQRETGGRAALPMWIKYMREALRDEPEARLEQPPGIVSVLIDPETGELAGSGAPDAVFEYFLEDQVPERRTDSRSDSNGDRKDNGNITRDLF
ncbi:penicillin-binding protein 1A [Thiohalophilus thiocyanatoxydans]|uniref:Penicillin-binding protein 1A n=1 Tax=Thiohalophilus thiocyanatoxydans TaxID=381308 RepID=A0A4R8IU43_9GAMM|nr:penicillin-binding protein 1A [Thiohalophilus thiocyanatoxydans]TDY03954.1 penicillin-binding protein 1A [Thiohalophilus thiocyanatoxydans]